MAIFITKINSASTNVSFNYLDSEAVWGRTLSCSYDFDISDVSYTDQDDVLYEGIDALNRVYLQKNIVGKIGSDEIINGLVTSISYPEGPNVGKTTASISIEERQRVDSYGSLSDVLNNIPSPQDVESFSESFSFERSQNSYSSSRDVSLKYKQDAGNFFLDKAKIFVQSIFIDSRPSFGYQQDGISEKARFNTYIKPIITEKIDLLNKSVSFSENININRLNDSEAENSSEEITIDISIDNNGYTNKNYNANLIALKEPLELNILNTISAFLDKTYQENFQEFKYPISISRSINSDGGKAFVSISFSNNPSLNSVINANYSVSKTKAESYDEYTFQNSISSRGPNKNASFLNSKNYWINNFNIGLQKIPLLFGEVTSNNLYEKSRSVSFEKFNRIINETVVYSTDPQYQTNGDILNKNVEISDNLGVTRHTLTPILAERILLRERAGSKTISDRSIDVNLTSKTFKSLENDALSIAQSYAPNSTYYYIDSKTSKFDPINGTSSASLTYLYFN
jgi:hypothetical protein